MALRISFLRTEPELVGCVILGITRRRRRSSRGTYPRLYLVYAERCTSLHVGTMTLKLTTKLKGTKAGRELQVKHKHH